MTWICKKTGIIIFALLSLLFVQSCDELGSRACCNSYILGYYSIPDIQTYLSEYESDNGSAYHKIAILPKSWEFLSTVFHDFPSDNGLYDEYCRLHNDTSYHSRLVHSAINHCYYPASDFCSLSLTCIDDWDDNHKANSSLGDIATFVAISIWPFIDSGYTEYDYDANEQPELFNAVYPFGKGYGKREYYPVAQIIDNISDNNMKLIGSGYINGDFIELCDIFIPKREDSTPCTLKLTMTNTDGKTYSREVVVQ